MIRHSTNKPRGIPGKLIVAAAIMAAVLGAASALAQVHQVDLSNPMDANPLVGGGGSNRPVQGFVPINGNDVITGNVTGLQYFHGQVGRPGGGNGLGTFSPYVFNGNQGTSQIGSFARLTAGNQVNGAVNQAYFLPSATVSTAGGSLYSAPIGGGLDSSLVPASVANPGSSSALLTNNQQQDAQAYGALNRNPATQLNPGDQGAILQDPMFWERTKAALLAQQQANQAAMQAMQNATQPATMPGTDGSPTKPLNPDAVEAAVSGGLGRNFSGTPGEVNGGTIGGKGLDAGVSPSSAKLLSALNQASGEGDNTDNGRGNNLLAGSADNSLANAAGTEIGLDPLTGRQREIKLPNRGGPGAGGGMASAAGTGRGGTGPQNGGPGTPGGTTTAPGEANPYGTNSSPGSSASLSPKRLEKISDNQLQAGSKLKPVKLADDTLTSRGGASMFDAMMTRGEMDLKQGRYLDATQAFQSAMSNKPGDPLAVIGRAHAELGAGMYSAAAFDLKFIYTRNPELVSVKYDVGSFIPANRQEFLLQDLKKLTGDKDAGDMAAFLYSYLCFQTGRTDLLQGELRAWGAEQVHDQWQTVALRSWGAVAKDK